MPNVRRLPQEDHRARADKRRQAERARTDVYADLLARHEREFGDNDRNVRATHEPGVREDGLFGDWWGRSQTDADWQPTGDDAADGLRELLARTEERLRWREDDEVGWLQVALHEWLHAVPRYEERRAGD